VESYAFQPPEPSYCYEAYPFIDEQIPYYFCAAGDFQTRYTVLYSHGNAEDLGQIKSWLKHLSKKLQVNVLGYDPKGYGFNRGTPTEKDSYRDIERVYQYLRVKLKIPTEKIILWGRSLGCGSSVNLAAKLCHNKEQPLAGLILQSPFASAMTVVTNKLSWLPWSDIFVNKNKIHLIGVPIFIMHGTEDTVINIKHSHELVTRANKDLVTFWPILGAGHNDVEKYEDALFNHVGKFITTLHLHSYKPAERWSSWS
jgi:abhydrolase domain-containing protein 17